QRQHAGRARARRHRATDGVHLLRDRAGEAGRRERRSRRAREAGALERHDLVEDQVRGLIQRQHRPQTEGLRGVGAEEGLEPVVQVDSRGGAAEQHDQRGGVGGVVDRQELGARHADRRRVADIDLDPADKPGAEGVDVRHQRGDDVDLAARGTRGERRGGARGGGGGRGAGRRRGAAGGRTARGAGRRRYGAAGRRRARCRGGGGGARGGRGAGRGRGGGRAAGWGVLVVGGRLVVVDEVEVVLVVVDDAEVVVVLCAVVVEVVVLEVVETADVLVVVDDNVVDVDGVLLVVEDVEVVVVVLGWVS